MYIVGNAHIKSISLEDMGGLSSLLKVVTRVKTQYAKYPERGREEGGRGSGCQRSESVGKRGGARGAYPP